MPKNRRKRKNKDLDSAAEEDLPDPSDLQVVIDGKSRKFTKYTRDFTRRYYPDVGDSSIMVPPIVFHQNWAEQYMGEGVCENVAVRTVSDSTIRSSVSEYRVAHWFRHLGQWLGGPSAIILGHKFENYLNKVKKKLQNVPVPATLAGVHRGEHDVLFIYPPCGVLVVSVKSVGANFGDFSRQQQEDILHKKLQEALEQLRKEVKVVKHVLADLEPPVTSTLALPNIPREMLASVFARCDCEDLKKEFDEFLKGDSLQLCLCLEEFPPWDRLAQPLSADDSRWKEGQRWWFGQRFPEADSSTPALNQQQYEDIFGRYCGLFSTVDIPHRRSEGRKGRVEVRRFPEAVSEVNRRFRSLLLLPAQTAILSSHNRRVYLYGLMGSGKSVMLVLKARHWLSCGCDVILINVSYDGLGSPIGYRLLSDIEECSSGEGRIKMLSVKLADLNEAKLVDDIRSLIAGMHPTSSEEASACSSATASDEKRPVNFFLDEVYPKFLPVFDALIKHFPESEIWAAGLEEKNGPSCFQAFEMTEVLRNPPAVQRVLQHTDYETNRREKYTTSGADKGLPTEGPEPRFILHQNHSSDPSSTSSSFSSSSSNFSFMASYSPLNCQACAKEMMGILSELGCFRNSAAEACSETSTTSSIAPKSATFMEDNASHLCISDVIMLYKDPEWNPETKERVCMYRQPDGSYKLDRHLLKEFVATIDQSLFVKHLRDNGCNVRTVADPHSEELALSDQDALTASWVNPASGLEWAVVIFMPGGPASESMDKPHESLELAAQLECAEILRVSSEASENPHECSESLENPRGVSETSKTDHAPSDGSSKLPGIGGFEDRITQGLKAVDKCMSARDRKYLFWAASRCTAQLVVLVP